MNYVQQKRNQIENRTSLDVVMVFGSILLNTTQVFSIVFNIECEESYLVRGLPHYMTLNFGGGSNWCSATAAAIMGTTLLGDKNNMALKSGVLLVSELPLVLGWKFQKLRFRVCLHVKNLLTIFISCFQVLVQGLAEVLLFNTLLLLQYFVWSFTAGSVVHEEWQSDEKFEKLPEVQLTSRYSNCRNVVSPQV